MNARSTHWSRTSDNASFVAALRGYCIIPQRLVQSGSGKILSQIPWLIVIDFTLLYRYVFLGCSSPGVTPVIVKRVPEIESRSTELVIPAVTAAIEERIAFPSLMDSFYKKNPLLGGMESGKTIHNQTIDALLAALVLWTILSNVYKNLVLPFLDNSSIASASAMTEKLGIYPLFFMSNWLDDLFITLFGARFYLKLKHRCKSTTAPAVFLLILFLDSCFIFLPYSIMFLFYDIPQGSDVALFIITWLHLGNFIPFTGSYTYNFAWLPALLFQCQIMMTLIYCASVVREISLVSVIFVAMGASLLVYVILSAICYFSLTLKIELFMPVVFHNPLSVFHNFSLGFLISYMTDDKRHNYLKINCHGKHSTHGQGKVDGHSPSVPVAKESRHVNEGNVGQGSSNAALALTPRDPVPPSENLPDPVHALTPLLFPEGPNDIADSPSLSRERYTERSSKWMAKFCCSCKKHRVEDTIPQTSPRAGDNESCASARFAHSTMDAAFWHPAAPRHRQRCRLLCEKVTKEESQWLSNKLYMLTHNHRRFGDVLAIIPIFTIYGTFTALGTETGVIYKEVLDDTTSSYKSVPNVASYITLLLARIIVPIMFSAALYYVMISSTYALEWLMHRVFLSWIGKSALPILYIQPVVISFISTNIGSIKIGPYSISIFLLYLLGGMFVCMLIGTCINTLMEELVRVVMNKSWSSFDRYKASLIAKRYRRKLNGER